MDGVSFAVQQGTVHALVGANGAGKSTLIKILAGALTPDSGSMMFDGAPYLPRNPHLAIKAGVSTIYQELNLLPMRSVLANITLGKEPGRAGLLSTSLARKQVKSVLALLKAEHIPLDISVEWLKVSEKQIVEIAKALLNDSKLLIMDEPTAALNDTETGALFQIIHSLRAKGVSILYVSHRLNEIFQIADEVTVLRDGQHIRTSPMSSVTPESLITDMIGRKLEGVFPQRNPKIGSVILQVQELGSGEHFRHVSFALHSGEVLAITGLTGSGKTELGKALFGDMRVDTGQIEVLGDPVSMVPTRAVSAGIGYLPEDRKVEGVLAEVSVLRNISLPILPRLADRLGLIRRKQEKATAEKQVTDLEIKTPSLAQLVRNLSGGNQQKVALAKWLASGSKILILMEPTQGIDVAVKFEIYDLITRLSRTGTAIILVSSELSEVIGLAHRILVMHNGRIAAELDGQKTNEEEILQYAFGQKN